MIVVEKEEIEEEDEPYVVPGEELEKELANLSLCSLNNGNYETEQTMKLSGYHKKWKLNILIDLGSSSNFINDRLAKGLNCQLKEIEPVLVTLANGAKL